MLLVLALDGVLSALMAVFFLPLRLGTVPFPISGLVSGALNALLVLAAANWTTSPRLAALPLWTWLATVVVFTFGGPGDDIVFGGTGVMEFGAVLLIVLGAAPPAWILTRRSTPARDRGSGRRVGAGAGAQAK